MQAEQEPQIPNGDSALETLLNTHKGHTLMGVQLEITVSVGKARVALSEMINLEKETVLQLDSRIDDPVDIYIGERLVARGELEEIDGNDNRLGVRLTQVTDLSDGA